MKWTQILLAEFALLYLVNWTFDQLGVPKTLLLFIGFFASISIGRYFEKVEQLHRKYQREGRYLHEQ